MFEKILKRTTWADIAISIVFLVFGILLMIMPIEMVSLVTSLLGLVFVAMGVLKLLDYFTSKEREDYILIISLISIIFGFVILFSGDIMTGFLRWILGIWILVAGIKNFQTSLVWKNVKSKSWTLTLLFAMLMIIAGFVILTSRTLAIQLIGSSIIVYAVLDIITRFIFMKKITE